ncbi:MULTISPECIES: hypothetical protein [Halorussus]|uniref:hypothetical protein n=1 Tax=Halorussus TaxID=1070314 RepID=UPI0020A195E8|nr:hypothetical protein [Halorussus vallis]USZ74564.1 hypothetical protein NGM07_14070 [Halorussus vallis]
MSPAVSLFFADFEDERGEVGYYWERLNSLDVPVPETTFVTLEATEDGYRWDTDEILRFMRERDLHRAFVRTQRKAATVRLREGSFVPRPDPEAVDRTVASLLDQNDEQGWPHGEGLVVREWLDLDFCRFPAHSCHPSIRFFVDDGEVVGQTPADPDADEMVCAGRYDYLEPVLAEADFSTPRRYAERIAAEFDEATWGVDFVLDARSDWYCTEFNFNGVYWNRREECYWNMCGQGDFEPFSPVEMHSAALWGVRPEQSERPDGRWW